MKHHQPIFYLLLSLIGIVVQRQGYCGSRDSGGCNNTIWLTCCSVIGGGRANTIEGPFSGIFSGEKNQVLPDASHNFIGGGHFNCTTSNCNVIGGGCANCTTGAYSAILGGSGNCDNGMDYVGIYGCNINGAANMSTKTFHANCLNAIDTPLFSTGHPNGSVNYRLFCDLLPTDKVLVIKL